MAVSTITHVDESVLAQIREEMSIRRTRELFILFTLGSQFDHLIMLAMGRMGVFCLAVDPNHVTAADVIALNPIGIILSGGPRSAGSDDVPFDVNIFGLGIPVLGICLGFQLWAHYIGCPIETQVEYGTHVLRLHNAAYSDSLFSGIDKAEFTVLESHADSVERIDWEKPRPLASTDVVTVAAANYGHLWGVQFHPEVSDTEYGDQIFSNFCFRICGAKDRFPAADIAQAKIAQIREKVGNARVLLALSGGSDSSVVAYLLKAAVPGQIEAVYIRGVDRPDDEAHVHEYFGCQDWLQLKTFDATDRFLEVLRGVEVMADKRRALRSVYRDILLEQADILDCRFIAQGTLYTDISESGYGYQGATKARIKLHHNVDLRFELAGVHELTPIADCVKDGARNIGREIGVPEALLVRQPFPGPGLVVRIEGEITRDKLRIARDADRIFIDAIRAEGLYEQIWQAGVVVERSITTCTKGDADATGMVLCLNAVTSTNGFTAQPAELDWQFIRNVSRKITNQVPEVGRVTLNVTGKPPATIEWG